MVCFGWSTKKGWATRVATDKQKYNFLAALVKQLDQAHDNGDDLFVHFDNVTGLAAMREDVNWLAHQSAEMEKKFDVLNQWVARLELEMEELDDSGSEGSSEEPDEDDDGDDDPEPPWDEPEVGSVRQPNGRVPAPVVRTGARQVRGRGRVTSQPKVLVGSGKKS